MEDGVTLTVELDSAEKRLIDLGYKQELKRVLNAFHLYCAAISTITVFGGVVPMYTQGFVNGGPVALVWYWWITVFFVHLVGLSFAEIASSFPLAGSLYFWAASLSPPDKAPIIAFFTGWFEFIGPMCGLSSVSTNGAFVIQTAIYLITDRILSNYEVFGISAACVSICALINLLPMRIQSRIFVLSASFQLLGAAALIITLPLVAPVRQPASYVFGNFYSPRDVTMTPSEAYSFVLALIVSQYSLYGYDGVCHLAEETKKSDRTAPIAIMASISTMSVIGWLTIVAATVSIQNPETLFTDGGHDSNTSAFLRILWNAFYFRYGDGSGAVVFMFIIYTSFFFGCLATMLSATRVCYSLARDGGFPLSRVFRRVSPSTHVPTNAVVLTWILGVVLLFPLLGSPIIFTGITSAQSIAWVGAYSVPMFLRLIQREKEFSPGPFYLADYVGVVGGKLVHLIALLWVLYTVIAFMLPFIFPVTTDNMNWAPVALGVCFVILTVWWFVDARHWFVGPHVARVHDESGEQNGNGEVEYFETSNES